ncbi:MAG: CDP-glycerol glycerophosphotransferase family protein [Pseudomonadota bacterium]
MRVAVLFIGGMHQALHIAPVAAALAERNDAEVSAYVATAQDAAALAALLKRLGVPPLNIIIMALPGWLMRLPGVKRAVKVMRLLLWSREIRRYDAILTAERSSTLLKRLPGRTPPMIHIPHGAGDRAKGFEPRLALFDHIVVAGPKDRRRMIAQGLVAPEHCTVSGAIKVAACRRMQRETGPLFGNDRPVILYNPHFDRRLASWHGFVAPLIDAVVADGCYNLIVAPHIRMFEMADAEERAVWRRRAVAGRVIVDLDSERLNDMSYALTADIYIGDVSSQVYEFLTTAKPCIFIDAHGADWRDNPDYAMWQFGPVCKNIPEIMTALDNAEDRHGDYVEMQRRMVADALGDSGDQAADHAAEQLLRAVAQSQSAS